MCFRVDETRTFETRALPVKLSHVWCTFCCREYIDLAGVKMMSGYDEDEDRDIDGTDVCEDENDNFDTDRGCLFLVANFLALNILWQDIEKQKVEKQYK